MSITRTLTATFADGSTWSRTTARNYAFVWRVTGIWANAARDVRGAASTRLLADKAAAVYTTPAACWIDPVVEIVQVLP